MKLKLRDFIIVGSVLFLGFLAYSNFQNRPQKWQATNWYKNIQYQLTKDGKKGNPLSTARALIIPAPTTAKAGCAKLNTSIDL